MFVGDTNAAPAAIRYRPLLLFVPRACCCRRKQTWCLLLQPLAHSTAAAHPSLTRVDVQHSLVPPCQQRLVVQQLQDHQLRLKLGHRGHQAEAVAQHKACGCRETAGRQRLLVAEPCRACVFGSATLHVLNCCMHTPTTIIHTAHLRRCLPPQCPAGAGAGSRRAAPHSPPPRRGTQSAP